MVTILRREWDTWLNLVLAAVGFVAAGVVFNKPLVWAAMALGLVSLLTLAGMTIRVARHRIQVGSPTPQWPARPVMRFIFIAWELTALWGLITSLIER